MKLLDTDGLRRILNWINGTFSKITELTSQIFQINDNITTIYGGLQGWSGFPEYQTKLPITSRYQQGQTTNNVEIAIDFRLINAGYSYYEVIDSFRAPYGYTYTSTAACFICLSSGLTFFGLNTNSYAILYQVASTGTLNCNIGNYFGYWNIRSHVFLKRWQ